MAIESRLKGDILIVDDTPANLRLLSGILKDEGYKVRATPGGALALAAARNSPPDLVLLDINMPEMDGYEVCRRMKADEALREIPVIFLSALSEAEDKIKAFRAGGIDYITKPFQHEEVCARVATHLRIRRLQLELQETIRELKRAEELRESLMHMVVHDLRSPLTAVLTSLQVLQMSCDASDEQTIEDLERTIESARAMGRMINSLLDVAKMEAGELELVTEQVDLRDSVEEAVRTLARLTQEHDVTVERPESPVWAVADASLVTRVVENLLGNAVKFTPPGGRITVRTSQIPSGSRLEVDDTGMGVPEEYREKIFEKFGQVEARGSRARTSTGLGLAFCKLVADAHGGRIGVDTAIGEGSTFWVELPCA